MLLQKSSCPWFVFTYLFFFYCYCFWLVSHPYEQLLHNFPKISHCSESFHFANLSTCPRNQTSDTMLARFCTSDKCDTGPARYHARHLLPLDSFSGPVITASFSLQQWQFTKAALEPLELTWICFGRGETAKQLSQLTKLCWPAHLNRVTNQLSLPV